MTAFAHEVLEDGVAQAAAVGQVEQASRRQRGLPPILVGERIITSGWAQVVSSLKSYIETGEALNIPVKQPQD